MRLYVSAFLFFLSVNVLGQDTLLKGRVLDSKKGKPLPYVNIMFQSRPMGTSGNEEGFFVIKVPDSIMHEKVRLSYVGFYPKVISLKELSQGLVYMEPMQEGLDEVLITKVLGRKQKVYRPNWKGEEIGIGNLNGGLYPSIIARFYEKPGKFKDDCFLEELSIYFYSLPEEIDDSAKFRLHIYEVGKDGKPGRELLKDHILNKKASDSRLVVNLLPEKIIVPDSGFFVGLEHIFIPENIYRETKDYYINDSLVAKNFTQEKYAPVYRGMLMPQNSGVKIYYHEPGGWVRVENWELSTEFFQDRIPAPIFKIKFTD